MSDQPLEPSTTEDDLPEQMRVRRAKLDKLVADGVEAYPLGYPRSMSVAELRRTYADLPTDTATGTTVSVTGRVLANRVTGKLCFASIREGLADVQVMLSLDRLGEERLAAWKSDVDLGDHVGVTGEVITSRRGELSVLAQSFAITAKALRPLPNAHKPMNADTRVRQRYVDLIVRPEAREMLERRSVIVRSVRDSLHRREYIEVETPMLQPVHGGAAARPFQTHHNALGIPLYLRIAPELYLKRLVVGGVERVFEINRNFRNEGVDTTHNPEFTMLEAYQAYGDYDTMAELTQAIVQEAAMAAFGTMVLDRGDDEPIDVGAEWRAVTVHDAVSEALGELVTVDTGLDELRRRAEAAGVHLKPEWGPGHVVLELYEQLVEGRTVQPTFFRDFPTEVSPLTRAHRGDPRLAERWDLVALGRELGTAYSELVDPVEQRARLTEQSRLAAGGDAEAMQLDEDFLRALEHGMPPSGGMGMGVDRLLMLLTGAGSIRDTILFPLVRPE